MSASAERRKKKEGFLSRQAKAKNVEPITEEELLRKDIVLPEDVLRLNKISESKMLCRLDTNFDIFFHNKSADTHRNMHRYCFFDMCIDTK